MSAFSMQFWLSIYIISLNSNFALSSKNLKLLPTHTFNQSGRNLNLAYFSTILKNLVKIVNKVGVKIMRYSKIFLQDFIKSSISEAL